MAKRLYEKLLENGLKSFVFHKEANAEGGYNYIGFINVSGYSIIMRENTSTGELDFSFGGTRLALWDTRDELTYGDWYELNTLPVN